MVIRKFNIPDIVSFLLEIVDGVILQLEKRVIEISINQLELKDNEYNVISEH